MPPIAGIIGAMFSRIATVALDAVVVRKAFFSPEKREAGDQEDDDGMRDLSPVVRQAIEDQRAAQPPEAPSWFKGRDDGGGGGLGKVAAAVAMAWKPLATIGVKLFAAFVSVPRLMEQYGAALVASRESLRMFDGATASAFARLEASRIQRQVEMGAATGQSNAGLAASQDYLERQNQPLREMSAQIGNTLGILGNTAAGYLAEVRNIALEVTGIYWLVKRIADNLPSWLGFAAGKPNGLPVEMFEGAGRRVREARRLRGLRPGFLERIP